MLSCIVFDFDGVLVDSNAVKRDAYFAIFQPYPAGQQAVAAILSEQGDGDRFQIIGAILQRLGLDTPDGAAVQSFAGLYNAICEEHTATCPAIPGAEAALRELSATHHLYVCSATPQEPLRRVVARRGWGVYFRDVLGRPESKIEHLGSILAREQSLPEEVLFVGDGRRDLEAAHHYGCPFVGVRNSFNDFDTQGLLMLDDLSDLVPIVAGHGAMKGGDLC